MAIHEALNLSFFLLQNFDVYIVYVGAEAMFADLGHFNRSSIQVKWLFWISKYITHCVLLFLWNPSYNRLCS